jgi:hypothetical protein
MANLALDRFGPALRWMSYEAIVLGLRMKDYQGQWQQPEYKSSMTLVWKLFEYVPFKRLSYSTEKGKENTKPGNLDKEITRRW